MFGHVVAVGRHQAEGAGPCAQAPHHLADRVRHVVVARAAEEGQPAGDGEAARIVLGQADLLAADLHGRGKAAVQVDHVDLLGRLAGHGQRLGSGGPDGRRRMQVSAFADVPMVVPVGAAVQEHPTLARDAQLARSRHAGHHHRCRLVDEGVGIHQPRVRVADPAVALVDRHQLRRAVALAPRGQRVVTRHRGKARHQRADGLLVRVDRAPARAAQCVLEQRVHDDRRAHAVQVLVVAPATPRVADQLRRAARLLGPQARRGTGALQAVLRTQRLAAAQQRGAQPAAGDLFGEQVQQVLRHVAAAVAVDVPSGVQAQPARDAARRIRRRTELRREARRGVGKAADHRHRVDGGVDAGRAGVLQCRPRGLRDQFVRRTPGFGRRLQIGDIAAADEHRHAPIDRLHRRPTCRGPSSGR